MRVSVKRICISMALVFISCFAAIGADQVTVLEYVGKVEVRESGGSWIPVEKGTTFSQGATISTGFNSSARLDLGSSELRVQALTRMTIRELQEKEGTVTTDLYLRVGKVQADVKSAEGLTHDFKLTSPVSTAAVRGTTFSYDGKNVDVTEGTVVLFNTVGQSRSVARGESGQASGASTPVSGEESLQKVTEVTTTTAPSEEGSGGSVAPPSYVPPTEPGTAGVDVTVQW